MARVEVIEAWRTGLVLPNLGLEPTGRSFVGITFKTATDEYLIPLSIESARALAVDWNRFASKLRRSRAKTGNPRTR